MPVVWKASPEKTSATDWLAGSVVHECKFVNGPCQFLTALSAIAANNWLAWGVVRDCGLVNGPCQFLKALFASAASHLSLSLIITFIILRLCC